MIGQEGNMDQMWTLSYRCDPAGRRLADRHYNRRKIGAANFVPPGRCLVLKCPGAVWTTSYPYAEYVRHEWAGAWMNSLFRREPECDHLASDLILAAVAATRWRWDVPDLGMITFVDAGKVRRKRDPGRCYRRAGFRHVGFTKGGLYALQLLPEDMPDRAAPKETQVEMSFGHGGRQ